MDQLMRPLVGTGVMIMKNGKVLLGRRRGAHGDGEYAFPGGHLEFMEAIETCVLREVAEECGVLIKNLRFQCFSNTFAYAPRHYVHAGFIAEWESGEPEVREKDRCESWEWHDMENLPEPLFELTRHQIESYRTGRIFFDAATARA